MSGTGGRGSESVVGALETRRAAAAAVAETQSAGSSVGRETRWQLQASRREGKRLRAPGALGLWGCVQDLRTRSPAGRRQGPCRGRAAGPGRGWTGARSSCPGRGSAGRRPCPVFWPSPPPSSCTQGQSSSPRGRPSCLPAGLPGEARGVRHGTHSEGPWGTPSLLGLGTPVGSETLAALPTKGKLPCRLALPRPGGAQRADAEASESIAELRDTNDITRSVTQKEGGRTNSPDSQ